MNLNFLTEQDIIGYQFGLILENYILTMDVANKKIISVFDDEENGKEIINEYHFKDNVEMLSFLKKTYIDDNEYMLSKEQIEKIEPKLVKEKAYAFQQLFFRNMRVKTGLDHNHLKEFSYSLQESDQVIFKNLDYTTTICDERSLESCLKSVDKVRNAQKKAVANGKNISSNYYIGNDRVSSSLFTLLEKAEQKIHNKLFELRTDGLKI